MWGPQQLKGPQAYLAETLTCRISAHMQPCCPQAPLDRCQALRSLLFPILRALGTPTLAQSCIPLPSPSGHRV